MGLKRTRAVMVILALVASSTPLLRAQLMQVESSGLIDSIAGSDLSLLGGANIGDIWSTSYSFVPGNLSLVSTGTNSATYHTVDALSEVQAGAFTATATHLALTLLEGESLRLLDGTLAQADLLQLSGYSPSTGLLILTSLYYPVGTLDRFDPRVPSFAASVINLELLMLVGGASALVESHAELRSLDPSFSAVPEPGTYGWLAAFTLISATAFRRLRKRSTFRPAQLA